MMALVLNVKVKQHSNHISFTFHSNIIMKSTCLEDIQSMLLSLLLRKDRNESIFPYTHIYKLNLTTNCWTVYLSPFLTMNQPLSQSIPSSVPFFTSSITGCQDQQYVFLLSSYISNSFSYSRILPPSFSLLSLETIHSYTNHLCLYIYHIPSNRWLYVQTEVFIPSFVTSIDFDSSTTQLLNEHL